jgi:hypothetical protein
MSQTFSLICPTTKQKIWVGQGQESMMVFYADDAPVLARLGRFLARHADHPLLLVCDDRTDLEGYQEFEPDLP